MPKTPPPLLGFNNNVRHRGRIFHIQTEDSGVKRPHVITHLFADGGRILKTVRTDYSEHLGSEDTPAVVRRMMKEQHKAMFVALRSGELDPVIEAALGTLPPAEEAPPETKSSPFAAAELSSPFAAAPPEALAATPEERAASAAPLATPMPVEWQKAVEDLRQRSAPTQPPPLTRPVGTPDAVEPGAGPDRSAPLAAVPRKPTPPPEVGQRNLTPPPASHSISAAVTAMAAKAAGLPPPPRNATPAQGLALGPPKRREGSGRYSISRPAPIFDDSAPPDSRSIFGDPLIGEKSLDDVILSYLAEDLEEPPK